MMKWSVESHWQEACNQIQTWHGRLWNGNTVDVQMDQGNRPIEPILGDGDKEVKRQNDQLYVYSVAGSKVSHARFEFDLQASCQCESTLHFIIPFSRGHTSPHELLSDLRVQLLEILL